MPMIPPLVREPPAAEPRTTDTPRAPFTGHPVDARMARTQRRYASNYNISYMYEPPKPMARPEPAPEPAPESTFDRWRAVADAERERLGISATEPHDAAMPGPAPRRRLHDALLGTTAVVLLSVLGGIVYYAWAHDGPDAAAPVGTATKAPACRPSCSLSWPWRQRWGRRRRRPTSRHPRPGRTWRRRFRRCGNQRNPPPCRRRLSLRTVLPLQRS